MMDFRLVYDLDCNLIQRRSRSGGGGGKGIRDGKRERGKEISGRRTERKGKGNEKQGKKEKFFFYRLLIFHIDCFLDDTECATTKDITENVIGDTSLQVLEGFGLLGSHLF
jgi:hypothetical protein